MSQEAVNVAFSIPPESNSNNDEAIVATLRRDFLEIEGLKNIQNITGASSYEGPGVPKSSATLGIIGFIVTGDK
ncbi:hypothetical protein ACGFZ9_06065 [Streptomyces mirabilis]|uniref:hypothetical protein n=1 Tax=Streptomyces mirabilis TaxID=68239 RepID=UPI0037176C08